LAYFRASKIEQTFGLMRKYTILFCSLIMLHPFMLSAFEGAGIVGARSAGMGRASVSLTDFWSIQNNPAGMALQENIAAGVYYENRFLLPELSLKSAAVIVPANFGVLGLSFNQFGYSLYNENKLGIAYARSFGPMLRIGLQLDYLSTRFGNGYEGKDNVTFELGVQSQLTETVILGVFLFNPVKARLSEFTDERLPVIMRFGLTYLMTDKLIGIAEIEKNFDLDPSLRFGMEYALTDVFYTRAGLATNPGLFTFGVGIILNNLHLDIAASMHQVLGVSAQAGIIYQFGKR
jgi:hypothetical protein